MSGLGLLRGPGVSGGVRGWVYSAVASATTSTSDAPAQPIDAQLYDWLQPAFVQASGVPDAKPLIQVSNQPDVDYQANGAMPLGKQVGTNPRELATAIVECLTANALAETPAVAGPGFINITLKADAISAALDAIDNESLGIAVDHDPHPIVIDMCSVNVAKQMHVGHLRSTIIGDAIQRVFQRLGRTVIPQNHLGDWGVPIAMVLHQLRARKVDLDALDVEDLERAYRDAQLSTNGDPRGFEAAIQLHAGPHRVAELEEQNAGANEAHDAARKTLVRLQQGDEALVRDWHRLIDCTMAAVYDVLDMLGVQLGPNDNRGESFYRDRLSQTVDLFIARGAAEEHEGAIVVRFEGRERPLLIRKSDGGFLYATTDLAAIRYRVQELNADRVIYVVDARQRDHFRDVFDGVRTIGWHQLDDGTEARLEHLAFGSVLGKDGKPLKTRSGDNVTLKSLLEEAIERGTAEVKKRADDPDAPTHGLSNDELAEIGRQVGIGAVKYADLCNDLVRDYVFDLDRMVAFEGNTGPYLQYAHARICSIFARAGDGQVDHAAPLLIEQPEEKQLALLLLRYGSVVHDVAESLEPHRLCSSLYEIANAYSAFYQSCPVLKAETGALRASRLRLCDLTRRVLADGLSLLGIDAPRRM